MGSLSVSDVGIIKIVSRSGRYRGAPGCRGTRFAGTCARTASNRSSPSLIGRAGWPHTPPSCRRSCRRPGSPTSRSGRPSHCTPDLGALGYDAWRPSLATGRSLGNRSRRRAAAACSCRWRSWPARHSSSTGRKIGRRRADQAAGRSRQALLPPRLHSPRLSSADPRGAVRRPHHAFRVLGGVRASAAVALEAGVPTKTHVLNLLYRLVEGSQWTHLR
jgi:hypothetical protein